MDLDVSRQDQGELKSDEFGPHSSPIQSTLDCRWAGKQRLLPPSQGALKRAGIALAAVVLISFLSWALTISRIPRREAILQATSDRHVLLLCLSGLGPNLLSMTPTLDNFISQSFSPPYMIPAFPTVPLSNQYTLMTGLLPESHGMVGETFLDAETKEQFNVDNPFQVSQSKWWTAEPLWKTAERAGISTAVHGWPGFNGTATFPNDPLEGTETLTQTADGILELLQPLQSSKPGLIAVQVPDIAIAARKHDLSSPEFRSAVQSVDSMIAHLLLGIESLNLHRSLDILIVSDHGLKPTSTSRTIQLDNLLDMKLISRIDSHPPLRGLHLKDPSPENLRSVYETLHTKAQQSGTWSVYTPSTMPQHYHFTHSPRIAPLWIVPNPGYTVIEAVDFSVPEAQDTGRVYEPRAVGGYDNWDASMQAVFAARGPSFPRRTPAPVFANVEVYGMICGALGVEPLANNGTGLLRVG